MSYPVHRDPLKYLFCDFRNPGSALESNDAVSQQCSDPHAAGLVKFSSKALMSLFAESMGAGNGEREKKKDDVSSRSY